MLPSKFLECAKCMYAIKQLGLEGGNANYVTYINNFFNIITSILINLCDSYISLLV